MHSEHTQPDKPFTLQRLPWPDSETFSYDVRLGEPKDQDFEYIRDCGGWSSLVGLRGLVVGYDLQKSAQNFDPREAALVCYGMRTCRDLSQQGYQMHGRVSVTGKKRRVFTDHILIEADNKVCRVSVLCLFSEKVNADTQEYAASDAVCTLELYQQALRNLNDRDRSDSQLYEAAELLTQWFEEVVRAATCAPISWPINDIAATAATVVARAATEVLLSTLNTLDNRAKRILISALADAEVEVRSEVLARHVANQLLAQDKRITQAATVYLIRCHGSLGRDLIREFEKKNPPNIDLIAGMVKLLDGGDEAAGAASSNAQTSVWTADGDL
jgi:hypothetical protein